MEPERWRRIEELCHAALEREEGQRAAFLAEACAGDESLRREVESLLAHENTARDFMEAPAVEVAAKAEGKDKSGSHPSNPASSHAVGKTVSHYRIGERLGGGGMGVVYKAEDIRLRRAVALKFLPEDLEQDHQAFERLRREAQSASALNHPNICTVYDIDEADGRPFIAMELLEGQTLRRRIAAKPLNTDEIIEMAIQVSDALDAAHSKGIIHRDIKPENIFILSQSGATRLKVLDFGIAKQLPARPLAGLGEAGSAGPTRETEASATLSGMILGTVSYMSPEQARGEKLDSRTDLFSFGAVLYEMATGSQSFPGNTSAVVFDAILNREPAAVSAFNPKIPPKLEEIIHKALEKDLKLRYQSASDLRADLLRLKRDTTSGRAAVAAVSDRQAPALAQVRARGRRHWAVAAAVFIVVVGTVSYLLRPPLPSPRVGGVTRLTHDASVGGAQVLATDGARIYFSRDAGGPVTLAAVSTVGGETVLIHTPLKNSSLEDISSDGTELLVTDRSVTNPLGDFPFYVVSAVDGSTRRFGNIEGHCGGWLADGRIICEKGNDTYLISRDGIESHKVATTPHEAWCPRSSPDDKVIRLEVEGLGLWEVQVDGTNLHPLLPGSNSPRAETAGSWTPDGKYFVFQSTRKNLASILAMREGNDYFHKVNHDPVQLTTGPMDFSSPILSRDGKKLFAVGSISRLAELARFDSKSGVAGQSYLPGMSATMLDFNRDGTAATFVAYPEGTLWRSKPDGSERIQLTFPPMVTSSPRWSPDGKTIAFFALPPGKAFFNIYLVPADGGIPEPMLPDDHNQIMPNWSSDGKRIAFSDLRDSVDPGIRLFDLKTKQVSSLACPCDVYSPSWSPDGRYLVARSTDQRSTWLLDFRTGAWTELVKFGAFEGTWSRNGKYVYFFASPKGDDSGIYRVRIGDHRPEAVLSLKDVSVASLRIAGGTEKAWFGLTPDGSIILPRKVTTSSEIYALDWEAP